MVLLPIAALRCDSEQIIKTLFEFVFYVFVNFGHSLSGTLFNFVRTRLKDLIGNGKNHVVRRSLRFSHIFP